MCQSLGWTWEEARSELDIPRLIDLNKYWAASPPVHQSVAAYMGIGDKSGAPSSQLPVADETTDILNDLLPPTANKDA